MSLLARYVTTLFVAYQRDLDKAVATLYERALQDVPPALLEVAIARAVQTRRFFPTVSELREDAEACRAELALRIPFTPCLACRDLRPGWMTVTDPAGVRREARCECWTAHQWTLRGAGWTSQVLFRPALPPAVHEEERHP